MAAALTEACRTVTVGRYDAPTLFTDHSIMDTVGCCVKGFMYPLTRDIYLIICIDNSRPRKFVITIHAKHGLLYVGKNEQLFLDATQNRYSASNVAHSTMAILARYWSCRTKHFKP